MRTQGEPISRWAAKVLAEAPEPEWALHERGYDALLEREIESRFFVGNGMVGVRGSLEIPTAASRPRTYVAGLYGAPPDVVGGPVLVPAPDWLRVALTADGYEIVLDGPGTESHSRTLDMRSGALRSSWEHLLPSGPRVRVETLRIASLSQRDLAIQVLTVTGETALRFSLEVYLAPVTLALILDAVEGDVSRWRAVGTGRRLAIAVREELYSAGGARIPPEPGVPERFWTWNGRAGEPVTFVRVAAFEGYRDEREQDRHVERARSRTSSVEVPLAWASHEEVWSERWQASDLSIEGDDEAQMALRFAVYQLNSAANPDDERVSISARGLTGDGYSGHVFWDTEIYLLPFYTLTWPEAARALLMYRYHTLPAARAKAAGMGYAGALYAWESADSGVETTPDRARLPGGQFVPILSGLQEQHISADIAYAVWRYWRATGDERFLLDAGAEIILETARFWASRAIREQDGRYHIRGIMGPDEYHESVDDNAYTNVMAQWNLETGLAVAQLLKSRWPGEWSRLAEVLRLSGDELQAWNETASCMYTGFDPKTGLYEQFDGFFKLKSVNLAAFEPRTVPMDVLLGREETQRSQVIKQADVVMLLALLWDRFPADVRAANFHYYEPRCGQGSSLSPSIHALVAARLGELDTAERGFREAASIDLGDTMGNIAGGLHMASLGGLWQTSVVGFAGMSFTDDAITFEPHLPSRWRSLAFPIRWRGSNLRVRAEADSGLRVTLERGDDVTIAVDGSTHRLRAGEEHIWPVSIRRGEGA